MGFGRKSRHEAQQQQLEAMRLQNQAYQHAQEQAAQYQAGFNTRNAGVIDLQNNARNWLARYGKGEDVASLNPAFAKTSQQAANAITNSMSFANKLGDAAGMGTQDAGYQAKLNSVASRQIATALGQENMGALQDELNSQRGIEMDTTNFLNADARAGFGMSSDLFNMTNSIFNAATTRRQIEIHRSEAMMGNFMNILSGVTQGALGFATMGASRALGGGVSGTGGAGSIGHDVWH